MNDSAYKISLDITEHGSQAVLKAKKSDTGRKIYISLRSGGTPYTIAEDCYAVFKATKPDGSILYNACTIEGNEIVYEFTEQTCTAVGRCRCEIALYGLDDTLITSPRFALLVDGTIYPDGNVESTDEFSALTHLISDTLAATGNANQAAEAAAQATGAANDAAIAANNAMEATIQATASASGAAAAANQAAGTANEATSNANTAAGYANNAVDSATIATQNANAAAASANEASQNATMAANNANKAAHTAKNLMVVGAAKGSSIALDDAIEQYLVGLRIFGKTTQDGTPTPDAPVDLVSVGDGGSITVNVTGKNDAQSMTIATPNGLPGIPVASDGNYIDVNGQPWVCDEIDFARGVYVKRVSVKKFNGTEAYADYSADTGVVSAQLIHRPTTKSLCTHGTHGTEYFWANDDFVGFRVAHFGVTTLSGFLALLAEQYEAGNPVTIRFAMNTPIETPLSEEELAAYADLHTYKDHTAVFNDAGAYMELEYAMDAKKYIDKILQPASVRVVSVNLPASAWQGSGSLYSQVVSIDGIFENSQVNLTLSVEQMAIFYEKDITFLTENDGGVVTVYVIGQKPTNDYTIQAEIVEVIV